MKTNLMTRIMLSCLFGAAAAASASSQTLASGSVRVDSLTTRRVDNRVDIAFRLNLDSLRLKSEQRLVFTPMLVAEGDTMALHPVIVNGRAQQVRYKRSHRATDYKDGTQPTVVRRINGTPQTVDYSQTIADISGFSHADLSLFTAEDLCGCGRLEDQTATLVGRVGTDTNAWFPELVYVQPAAEARKERQEKGEAFLSFRVNKTDIVGDLFDNARELAKITRTIDLVRADKNVAITGINIHGYASPDGPYKNNERLARERAAALKSYVAGLYDISPELFSSSSTAEDWEGFIPKVAATSSIKHWTEINRIAESAMDPDAKDQRIRKLYPDDYRIICDSIYPRLRHSDYTISYTVRPFSVEEAKQILKTRPQQLSLEEMYLVAQTMEPGSEEFNEVFDIAVRLFPNDSTANLNAACAALQRGDMAAAAHYAEKSGSSAEAVNVRATIAYLVKDYANARRLFDEAAKAGCREAEENARRVKPM